MWIAIDRFSRICESDLSDKNEPGFLPSCSRVNTTVRLHHQNSYKTLREKSK